jgi:hypothetical protein
MHPTGRTFEASSSESAREQFILSETEEREVHLNCELGSKFIPKDEDNITNENEAKIKTAEAQATFLNFILKKTPSRY